MHQRRLWKLDIIMGIPLADGRKAKMVTGIADHRLASLRVCRCWLPVWLPESRMHWGLQMSESNSDRGVRGEQPCGGRQRQHRECATWREPLSCPRTGRPLPQRVTAPGCHGLSEARGSPDIRIWRPWDYCMVSVRQMPQFQAVYRRQGHSRHGMRLIPPYHVQGIHGIPPVCQGRTCAHRESCEHHGDPS